MKVLQKFQQFQQSQQSKGFILVTTLIFILLLSLLAYQALESTLLEMKLHQIVKRQDFLFNLAQVNLKSAENNLENHCTENDKKNKNQCLIVESVKKSDQPDPDHEEYRITSQTFEGDMTVILQSVCIKAETRKACSKRLSWEQFSGARE